MCMCGLAFHWQHFGSPAEFMLQTKASFPPLNCEVQQFIFTGAWWLVNRCEDSGWAMIHGLSRAHLGVSFSAPYHYKSFYIITLGNGKCFVAMWLRSVWITGAIFQPPKWNLYCASGCTECPRSFLRCGCVFGLFATLYHCAGFPVGPWRFSFHAFLLRCPDFRASGFWDQGCRSKNQ